MVTAKKPAVTRPGAPRADMNVTPLIDVLLVLLIIFIASLPLTQKGLDIDLPESARQRHLPFEAAPHHIVLEVDVRGAIAINRQPVDPDDLEHRLRDVYSTRRDRTLYLMGDGRLRYGRIVEVIDAARGAGVARIGIVTDGMRAAAR